MISQLSNDIVLNVKVYRLFFPKVPVYDSRLTDQDISELFSVVNDVWACAHIRWKTLSFQRRTVDAQDADGLDSASTKRELRKVFERISPVLPDVLINRIWNVCLLNRFPIRAGGVYLPSTKAVFFAETSRNYRPNGLTLAHELGHMLGLRHLEKENNLMNPQELGKLQQKMNSLGIAASGLLTGEQVAEAMDRARLGPY